MAACLLGSNMQALHNGFGQWAARAELGAASVAALPVKKLTCRSLSQKHSVRSQTPRALKRSVDISRADPHLSRTEMDGDSLPDMSEPLLLHSCGIFWCGDGQIEKKPGVLSASCCKGTEQRAETSPCSPGLSVQKPDHMRSVPRTPETQSELGLCSGEDCSLHLTVLCCP